MSEENSISSLFDRSGNLTLETMERYLKGRLTEAERSVVEQHLEESSFDREALEGLAGGLTANAAEDVAGLQALVEKRAKMATAGSPVPSPGPTFRKYSWAAAAGLIAIISLTALLVYMFRETVRQPELAILRTDSTLSEASRGVISPVLDTIIRQAEMQQEAREEAADMEQLPVTAQSQKIVQAPKAPPPPQKISVVEDDILVEADMDAEADESVQAPAIGGMSVTGDKSQSPYASSGYTIDAEVAGQAQMMKMAEEESQEEESPIFMVVEQMPEFPGGEKALMNYLAQNIQYPQSAKESGVQGRVFVTFVVEKDGTVDSVRVLRGIGSALDEEAIRVVKSMPRWVPGLQRGKAVRVQYNLPIMFQLQ